MKKYNVTVNGTAYEVTLEAVDASEVKTSPAPAAAPAAAHAPTPPLLPPLLPQHRFRVVRKLFQARCPAIF